MEISASYYFARQQVVLVNGLPGHFLNFEKYHHQFLFHIPGETAQAARTGNFSNPFLEDLRLLAAS